MRKALLLSLIILFFSSSLTPAFAYDPRYLFTDQEKDPESGLYNFDAREYNPSTGRFLQPDPVLNNLGNPQQLKQQTGQDLEQFLMDPQNLNPYSYTRNNPVNYVDPEGEFAAPIVTDVTTDIYFFNESLTDYQKNPSWGNAAALAIDTIGLLPIMPSGTGKLFKSFVRSANNLVDLYKLTKVFIKAEKIKKVLGLANFANKFQLLENYIKHKGSLGNISLKDFSNKAQDLFKRFTDGDSNILSGFKNNNRVLFDKVTKEFSIVTKDNIIKTFFIPNVKDPYQYFLRNIDQ